MSRISVGKKYTKRVKASQKPAAGDGKKVFNLSKGGGGAKGSPLRQREEENSRATKLEDMFREDVREFAPVAVEFVYEEPRMTPTEFASDLRDPPIGIRILQQLFSYGRLEVDHPEAALRAMFPGNITINIGDKRGGSQKPPWMQKKKKAPPPPSRQEKGVDFEEGDEEDDTDEEENEGKVGGEEDTVYISNLQLPSAIEWMKVDTIGRRRPIIMDLFSPVATVVYSHKQRQEKLQNTPSKKKKRNRFSFEDSETVYGVAASMMVVGKRGDDFRAKRLTIFPATPGCAVRRFYLYFFLY